MFLRLFVILAMFSSVSILVPERSYADTSPPVQLTHQEFEELGIEENEIAEFLDYLDDQEYYLSDDFEPSFPSSRSWGNEKASDTRIGRLVLATNPSGGKRGNCTANQLTSRFWITAKHCVQGYQIGYIERQGGQYGGVEAIFEIGHPQIDLALIRVDGGLDNHTYFHITHESTREHKDYYVTGYSSQTGHREYPTWAWFRTTSNRLENHSWWHNLIRVEGKRSKSQFKEGKTPHPDGICRGDSGVALRDGDAIFGILTSMSLDPAFNENNCSTQAFVTATWPHQDEINNTIARENRASNEEKARAFRGRQLRNNLPHTRKLCIFGRCATLPWTVSDIELVESSPEIED